MFVRDPELELLEAAADGDIEANEQLAEFNLSQPSSAEDLNWLGKALGAGSYECEAILVAELQKLGDSDELEAATLVLGNHRGIVLSHRLLGAGF